MKQINLLVLVILFSCSKNKNSQEQNQEQQKIYCSGDYSTAGVLVDINEKIYNDNESVNAYS